MAVFIIADYIKKEENSKNIILILSNYINKNFTQDNRIELVKFFTNLKRCLKGFTDKIAIVEKIEQMSLQ